MDADDQFAAAAKARGVIITSPYQSRYRLSELEFALSQSRLPGIVTATAFRPRTIWRLTEHRCCGLATSQWANWQAARLPPNERRVIQIRRAPNSRNHDSRTAQKGGQRHARQLAGLAASVQFDDPVTIQVNQRPRVAEGRDADRITTSSTTVSSGRAMRLTNRTESAFPAASLHCYSQW